MDFELIIFLGLAILSIMKLWFHYGIKNDSKPSLRKIVNYYLEEENMIELFLFHRQDGLKSYKRSNIISAVIYLIILLLIISMFIR